MLLYSCGFFPTLEQNCKKRIAMKHLLRFLVVSVCIFSALRMRADSHELFSRSFTIIRPAYDLIEVFRLGALDILPALSDYVFHNG